MTTPHDKAAEALRIAGELERGLILGYLHIATLLREYAALLQTQQAEAGIVPLTEEKTDMLHWFTARRVDNAGGTPGYTLYKVKMGAHPEYQLYRNEAYALWRNLGDALGILSKEK